MRKLLPMLAATAVLVGACTKIDARSAEVFGDYTLVSINDAELPYTDPKEGRTVSAASLSLRSDWSFSVSLTIRQGNQEPGTESSPGTFTLDDSSIVHLSFDDADSIEGAWDGNNQITIIDVDEDTLVFRR